MNESVHIVGGGASLLNFEWGSLRHLDVIAVNDAYKKVPDAKVVLFWDAEWLTKNREGYFAHKGKKIRACHLSQVAECANENLTSYLFTGETGLTMEPYRLRHGKSTGYAAINLSAQLGYKKIFLHGFDMQRVEGRTHWHENALRSDSPLTYQIMARNFATLVPPLKELGIEVFNCSPVSALDCFPKVNWI